MKKYLIIMLFSILGFISISFSQEQKENELEQFELINCDDLGVIKNIRFFFLKSNYGFIIDSHTDSPLQDELPKKIGVQGPILPTEKGTKSAIILQEIFTKPVEGKTFEGGIPGLYVITVICGIIGFLIAPIFKKNSVIGLITGLIIGYVGCILVIDNIFKFTKNDIRLYVDNALGEDVELYLDNYDPIQISSKSQLPIEFEEGTHLIKIISVSTHQNLESASLESSKFRDNSGKELRGYYVYNIGKQNSYKIYEEYYEYEK